MCEAAMLGTAAVAAAGGAPEVAATSGLFGAGGAFGLAQTLATVGTVGGLASGAMGVMGAQQSSAAQTASARYQAQVMANNQTIAQRNADAALQAGQAAEQQQRQKTAAMIASQRAALAANGVDLSSGSALDLQADTATLGELNAQTVRNNAERHAWGYVAQADAAGAQSGLDMAQAGWAGTAGMYSSLDAGLASATSLSSRWAKAYADGTYNGLSTNLFM